MAFQRVFGFGEQKSKPEPVLLPSSLQDVPVPPLGRRQEGEGGVDHVLALPESRILSCLLPLGMSHPGQHSLPLLPSKVNTTGENKAETAPGWILDFSLSAILISCGFSVLLEFAADLQTLG